MESLAKCGHNISVLDEDPHSAAFRSKYCSEGIVTDSELDSESYMASVLRTVQSRKFDLLIPISDRVTALLSDHRESISDYVDMLLPSKSLMQLAVHKDRTYAFANENGIAIPETFFPHSINDAVDYSRRGPFPCVVKKARGTANKGNSYFYRPEDLIAHYKTLDPQNGWPVIQKFVEGDFYGFLAVAYQGELLDCLMFKATQYYSSQGTSLYCISIFDSEFLNTARRIVKTLSWTGAINLDFIKCLDGKIRLLEINPRLSGSVTFAYSLGVDLPRIYLELAQGKFPTFKHIDYRTGVTFRYILPLEIMFTLQHKRHLPKLFANFFKIGIKDDINWRDPHLLLWKLKHVWWHWRDANRNQIVAEDFSPQHL